MPDTTPSAMEAARKIHAKVMGLPSDDGVGTCPSCRAIAAALNAYTAERIAEAHANTRGAVAALAAERDAALARAEAAESERDNIARNALQAIAAQQRAEAQVARQEAQRVAHEVTYHKGSPLIANYNWPADLLEAVGHLTECKHDEPLGLYQMQACRKCIEARAVLMCYGLLSEEARS